jgi:type IV pilus assembly protein PilB
MADSNSISGRVLEALVSAGLVTAEQVKAAEGAAVGAGTNPGLLLLQRDLVTSVQIANVLEDELGIPRVDLASYAPDDSALQIVPASVAHGRGVLPLFEIEGMLTVAIGEPTDVFILDDLGAELGLEIEAVLADAHSVREAIAQYYGPAEPTQMEAPEPEVVVGASERGIPVAEELEVSAADFFELPSEETPVVAGVAEEAEVAAPERTIQEVVETAPAGTSTIDLDVLAVADERKVAVLVSEIMEQAVARGANRVHLLPYKGDFFLVFRIQGRLEKIASAPLSMQQPLIDGLKSYAKLSATPSNVPALGRMHADVAGKEVVVTTSVVPTVAGTRLVISLAPPKGAPKRPAELGMSDAEERALYAMVERGRGILLVAGPVAGGRSTTYYSLLNHAGQVGKTAYSVESAIQYEIPAVAQVLVSPGSPIPAASYFSAGMRQDTDVIALDAMTTVEDVHLAIEAAGMGKLVVVTFAGGDIVSAVRRMLDLGAEPVSLASALTLAVGTRVVRLNCPNCATEETSPLADRIPGAAKGMKAKRGTGCPNCGKTGFQGATGIFEVLPFTEPVRGAIAKDASLAELQKVAKAAGMRPMIASGLAKVTDGLVSPDELNRVLRFTE